MAAVVSSPDMATSESTGLNQPILLKNSKMHALHFLAKLHRDR
jgi:hypothetical protein